MFAAIAFKLSLFSVHGGSVPRGPSQLTEVKIGRIILSPTPSVLAHLSLAHPSTSQTLLNPPRPTPASLSHHTSHIPSTHTLSHTFHMYLSHFLPPAHPLSHTSAHPFTRLPYHCHTLDARDMRMNSHGDLQRTFFPRTFKSSRSFFWIGKSPTNLLSTLPIEKSRMIRFRVDFRGTIKLKTKSKECLYQKRHSVSSEFRNFVFSGREYIRWEIVTPS